ncbi:MAG: DUF1338 domain-containing protein [Planctomycetota bacterium]
MNQILSTLVDDSPRQQFLAQLFQSLWQRYRNRVTWVSLYERLVHEARATFVNDHIALRTIASQVPLAGIATLARIFEALGYYAAGTYQFPDKYLSAVHFEHPNRNLPKIFISELQLAALPTVTRETILRTVRTQRLPISDETLATLAHLDDQAEPFGAALLQRVVAEFHELPWNLPEKADVLAVNQVSQYAAWVLVHGYNVNHFTGLINSHGPGPLSDIERTAAALAAAGVPMKAEMEGLIGSRLRQTATEAVVIDVPVAENGLQSSMPWTYAYFELAERGTWLNPITGLTERFEGFLGPQATQLFDLTRVERPR